MPKTWHPCPVQAGGDLSQLPMPYHECVTGKLDTTPSMRQDAASQHNIFNGWPSHVKQCPQGHSMRPHLRGWPSTKRQQNYHTSFHEKPCSPSNPPGTPGRAQVYPSS